MSICNTFDNQRDGCKHGGVTFFNIRYFMVVLSKGPRRMFDRHPDEVHCRLGTEVSMLERLAEQLKAGEHAARSVADERQRAVQYAEAEKVALTRLLHQQDARSKDLLNEIQEVRRS